MTRYQEQGEGELVPGRGFEIVRILNERNATGTQITLRSGETVVVTNVNYGRDIGAEWEHLYFENGDKSCFLSTADVVSLVAPETSATIYASA